MKTCRHPNESQVEGCKWCKLYADNAGVRERWDANPDSGPPKNVHPIRAAATLKRSPCRNLGSEVDSIECPTCNGKVTLKVFACAVHKTCTLGKRVKDHGCCDGQCEEYRSVPT